MIRDKSSEKPKVNKQRSSSKIKKEKELAPATKKKEVKFPEQDAVMKNESNEEEKQSSVKQVESAKLNKNQIEQQIIEMKMDIKDMKFGSENQQDDIVMSQDGPKAELKQTEDKSDEQDEVPPTFSMLEFSNYIEQKHAYIDQIQSQTNDNVQL